MKYTLEYFIRKFSKIPSRNIGSGCLENKCALRHCGVRDNYIVTPQASALADFFRKRKGSAYCGDDAKVVWNINDSSRFGRSPKSRILGVLRKLKRTL